jgi:hypothetical protein
VFGITLILCMYVLPDGILGGLRRLYNRVWNVVQKPRPAAPPSAPHVESASH